MIKLSKNNKSTGEWDRQGADQKKVLVSLDTALKQERAKNKKISSDPTSSANKNPATEPGNSTSPHAWKSRNLGKTTPCPDTGAKYEWCKLHGR